jgi:hypothetical protein
MELPNWPNCTWVFSIDGTAEAFAKMRAPGIYEKIKQNVRDHSELNIQISCVLTSITKDCVEDLVQEWGPLARGGIIFDFFTPVTGLDEALWLDWPTRDRLIDQILALKKKYPDVKGPGDATPAVGIANAYDAMHLVAMAIEKAGSTNGDAIRQGFYKIDSYDGLIKKYNKPFTPDNHDAIGENDYIWTRFIGQEILPVEMAAKQ